MTDICDLLLRDLRSSVCVLVADPDGQVRQFFADVAMTSDLPVGRGVTVAITADTVPAVTRAASIEATSMLVSSHYFQTVGLAIRQGRAFSDTEPAYPRVAVINQAMARRLWAAASPVAERSL